MWCAGGPSMLDGGPNSEPAVAASCLVCEGVLEAGISGVFRCAQCGFALRRESDGWTGIGEMDGVAYPEDGAVSMQQVEAVSFWFRHRNQVLTFLLERFPPGGPIWDVGAGNGFQAMDLERSGRAVVCVEPGMAGCRNAQARGLSRVVRSTLEALRLPSGRVPAIVLLDVLEHLRDPAPVLEECARVLRPGGRLYATVPAHALLWSHEDVYAHHARRYGRRLLTSQLESARFRIEYLSSFFSPLVVPAFILRALPYRLGRRTGSAAKGVDPREHAPGGIVQRLTERLLALELAWIRRGHRLGIGTSLMTVASRGRP
jgi:2-polyprenyl-3-methyl-5-hydroxy-6-metoxy-1,4-benzoquinol methylase